MTHNLLQIKETYIVQLFHQINYIARVGSQCSKKCPISSQLINQGLYQLDITNFVKCISFIGLLWLLLHRRYLGCFEQLQRLVSHRIQTASQQFAQLMDNPIYGEMGVGHMFVEREGGRGGGREGWKEKCII